MALRGIERYFNKSGTMRAKQVVIDGGVAAGGVPTYEPLFIQPSEPPTNAAEGGIYYDDDNHCLMQYTGSGWEEVGAGIADNATFAGTLTSTGNFVVGSNKVVVTAATGATAVNLADGLTVNSIIVPTVQIASFRVGPHASVTEYDLMVAPRALTVTRIDVVPSTLQGGALTATVVKATGTATPAFGTTPMHAANAINLNTGAYTVQNISLTATTADLSLVAGERIGIDYSAALTAGHAAVTISYKYV